MCTYKSATEVLVCDVSRDRVEQRLTRALGDQVTFLTVDGEGTLVTCLDGNRAEEFRQTLDAAIAE